jgi:hypothetical protein
LILNAVVIKELHPNQFSEKKKPFGINQKALFKKSTILSESGFPGF